MPCPIARSLERVGEWWSMLILRDALHGLTRFDEFQKSLGIAPNILARRLDALVEAGLLRAPPLQRAAAARRIPADRARARFPPGAPRPDGLGQSALRARGRERTAHQHETGAARPHHGRPRHRPADHGTRLRVWLPVRRRPRTRQRYAAVRSTGGAAPGGAPHEHRGVADQRSAGARARRPPPPRSSPRTRAPAAGADRADAAPPGLAERPRHGGAGRDRADRDLVRGASSAPTRWPAWRWCFPA